MPKLLIKTAFVEGYWEVKPRVKAISFPQEDRIQIALEDGRFITCLLDRFPSIQQLSPEQRQN